jgi:hypothetical protein
MLLRSLQFTSHRKYFLALYIGFAFLLASLFMHSGKVFADCGVPATGNPHAWQGLVVNMQWNDNGVMENANGVQANITSAGQSDQSPYSSANSAEANNWAGSPAGPGSSDNTFPDNNAVQVNSSEQAVSSQVTDSNTGSGGVNFSQVGSSWAGCSSAQDGGNPNVVVLGYGNTSPLAGTKQYNWVLRCGSEEANEQIFTITGEGTPNGAPSGGTWSTQTRGADNGDTSLVTLVYTPPTPPPPNPQQSSGTLTCFGLVFSAGTSTNGFQTFQNYGIVTLSGATLGAGTTYDVSGAHQATQPTDVNNNVPVAGIAADVGITAQYASVSIAVYYNHLGPHYVTTINETTPQCYQATCYIDSVVGNLPNGDFSDGGSGTATVTVYNNSYTYYNSFDQLNQLTIPGSLGGDPLIVQSNVGNSGQIAGGVPGLGNTVVSIPITAPTSGTSFPVSAAVSYNNYFFLSGVCPGATTGTIYQPPSVTVAVACNLAITGSATDIYIPGQPVQVDLYADAISPSGLLPSDSATNPNTTPGDTTSGNPNYSYAVPSTIQDGQNHTIYAIAIDPFGIQNSAPVSISMTGCESFHLQPGANGGALSPSIEAPTSFDGTATVKVGYGPNRNSWYGPDLSGSNQNDFPNFPGVPASVTYTLTKNGAVLDSGSVPAPNPPNNGRFNDTTYTPAAVGIAAGSYTSGDTFCINVSADPIDGFIQNDGTILSVSNAGPGTQSSCDTIKNRPFFKVYNSGIQTGGAFKAVTSDCSGGGELASWNDDTGTNPTSGDFGASAQFSALALLNIVGFASDQGTFGNSPTGLTFANNQRFRISSDNYSPKLGGSFDSPNNSYCLSDQSAPPTATPIGSSIGIDKTTTGSFTAGSSPTSQTSIFTIKKIGTGNNISIFVTGDVYIANNIVYNTSGWSYAPGNSNIPSFVLHATGNIYISPSVNELDGLYISQGEIYTCSDDVDGQDFNAMPATELFSDCNNQLTVDGSFVASQVNMMRTYGSLRDETPVSGSGTPGQAGATQALLWAADLPSSKLSSYAKSICTQIDEPSEPNGLDYSGSASSGNGFGGINVFTDPEYNYLCVPPNDGSNADGSSNKVQIAWTCEGGFDPHGCTSSNYSSLSTTGYCTGDIGPTIEASPWNYPSTMTWDDNQICSNYPITFTLSATDPSSSSQYCTEMNDPRDTQGASPGIFSGKDTDNAYLCLQAYQAGTAGVAAPPGVLKCSNSAGNVHGTNSGLNLTPTCAAEVFQFSPELYLSTPDVGPSSNGAPEWDAVTSLPPVL